MARPEGNKARILALLHILQQHTDDTHIISVPEILAKLDAEGFVAERKSIYSDIEALQGYGYDIQLQKGRGGGYRLANRRFQLAEVKLLIDLVQASRFITPKKSAEMIKKLTELVSVHQAPALRRQVYASSRIKRENEGIYQSVDTLYRAISENRQVKFVYQSWTLKKSMQARRDGKKYTVSPWAMLWEDENYYLVAYEENRGMRHYRVDKMTDIELTICDRQGGEFYSPEEMRGYAKPMFGMYAGEVQNITFCCDESVIGAMLDRFGTEVMIVPNPSAKTFTLHANVAVSPPFFGWVCGFGGRVRILAPEGVKRQFADTLTALVAAQNAENAE